MNGTTYVIRLCPSAFTSPIQQSTIPQASLKLALRLSALAEPVSGRGPAICATAAGPPTRRPNDGPRAVTSPAHEINHLAFRVRLRGVALPSPPCAAAADARWRYKTRNRPSARPRPRSTAPKLPAPPGTNAERPPDHGSLRIRFASGSLIAQRADLTAQPLDLGLQRFRFSRRRPLHFQNLTAPRKTCEPQAIGYRRIPSRLAKAAFASRLR